MGTTVTALLRSGNRLALAHIGDSRAYLLRDGALTQITKDHTFVQTLVDEGRLTPEEAEHHPQRSVLMRVLSDIVDEPEPDFSMRESRVGDRYLLCSDGLSGVVSFETLQETLASGEPPGVTCERLVALARRAGAPDNVTCIVADVVDEAAGADAAPSVVGAASVGPQRRSPEEGTSSAERAAALTFGKDDGVGDDDTAAPPRRSRGRGSSGSPASRWSRSCSPAGLRRLALGPPAVLRRGVRRPGGGVPGAAAEPRPGRPRQPRPHHRCAARRVAPGRP